MYFNIDFENWFILLDITVLMGDDFCKIEAYIWMPL